LSGERANGPEIAPISVDEVVRATGGRCLAGATAAGAGFVGVSIDSRTVAPGELFFCVKGDRFDGHDFVAAALGRGATGVVVQAGRGPEVEAARAGACVVEVADVRLALQALAAARRAAATELRVVGVTGSVGKTTTKELLAAVLAEAAGGADGVLATVGNLNNDLGVPLTLLRLAPGHRFAVIEMGMSGLGEIDLLARLSRPEVAVVTKVAPAHLLQMGSLDTIARAKGEIWRHLGAGGVAVRPVDDARLQREATAAGLSAARTWTFGTRAPGPRHVAVLSARAGAGGTDVELALPGGAVRVRLALVGAHNADNAAAAAAAATVLGVAPEVIARGLAAARPAANRSQQIDVGRLHVIADFYNANPASSAAALDALAALAPHGAVAVLGDMLELGPQSGELHHALGRRAGALDLAALVCVGAEAREIARGAREAGLPAARVHEADGTAAAAAAAAAAATPGGWLLIKASRGMRLEGVLEALRERAARGEL